MNKSKQTILERVQQDFAIRRCPEGVDPIRHADREQVRAILGNTAIDLVRICPMSRELNHALNRLEEAVHWAHDAIDRYGQNSPEGSE